MKETSIRFSAELYPKEAVMKAAYHFIDKCYIRVDLSDGYFIIDIKAKKDASIDDIALEFENELLAQAVRFQVYQQTHTIRDSLMARAMSSTMAEKNDVVYENELPDKLDSLENILMDWFEKNEK